MTEWPDPAVIGRELLEKLGLDGVVQAGGRAEACRRSGDEEGARFWSSVGREMWRLAEAGGEAGVEASAVEPSQGRSLASRVSWRLMQQVELFRHRAAQCRSRANEGSEAYREEMREIEQYWLELAVFAEALARQAIP